MTRKKLHKLYINYVVALDRTEELSGGTAYDLAVSNIPQFLDYVANAEELESFAALNELTDVERAAVSRYIEWKRNQ